MQSLFILDVIKLYINREPANNKLTFWMSGTEVCADNGTTQLKFSLQRTTIAVLYIAQSMCIVF